MESEREGRRRRELDIETPGVWKRIYNRVRETYVPPRSPLVAVLMRLHEPVPLVVRRPPALRAHGCTPDSSAGRQMGLFIRLGDAAEEDTCR